MYVNTHIISYWLIGEHRHSRLDTPSGWKWPLQAIFLRSSSSPSSKTSLPSSTIVLLVIYTTGLVMLTHTTHTHTNEINNRARAAQQLHRPDRLGMCLYYIVLCSLLCAHICQIFVMCVCALGRYN